MNAVDDEDMIDQQVDAKDHPIKSAPPTGKIILFLNFIYFVMYHVLFFTFVVNSILEIASSEDEMADAESELKNDDVNDFEDEIIDLDEELKDFDLGI